VEVVARAACLSLCALVLQVRPACLQAESDGRTGSDAVAQRVLIERQQLDNARLDREAARLEAARPGAGQAIGPGSSDLKAAEHLLQMLAELDPAMRSAAVQALLDASQPLLNQLQQTVARLAHKNQELAATWAGLAEDLRHGQRELLEVQSGRRVASTVASLLSVDKRWFWLFGGLSLATLLAVVLHERRHEIRRRLNGSRARAMGLSKFLTGAVLVLLALGAATFVMEDRIYEFLLTASAPATVLPEAKTEGADLATQLDILRQSGRDLKQRYAKALAEWQRPLLAHGPEEARLLARLLELHNAVQQGLLEVKLREVLAGALAEHSQRLDRLHEQLAADNQARSRYLRLKELIRGGVGLALLGLTLLGTVLFHRGLRRRQQVIAETCPLCLGRGHLAAVSSAAAHAADWTPPDRSRTSPAPKAHRAHDASPDALATVRCRNVLSRQPYEECEYRFADAYRALPKLCFPTLGVPQAGKTHWLAMIYWQLNRGNYPDAVEFERLRSQSSQDFDLIVEEILTSRIGTAATQRERIPHPLVFNFRDHDRWGRSNLLVNIFDYSGEVTSDMGVEDFRRRRALDADGYLFFLDPTYPSEPQAKALVEFREDLRLMKGVRSRGRIRTPMALCVSKIDLLPRQGFSLADGCDAVERFYQDLKRIDPSGETLSLPVMQARSQLISRLRETIWPGWQIERQVRDLFGSRYMFFPLTPVGLEGRGETDLSLRTISPFGLLEPLVWLLHMNGYPIV